MKSKFLLVAGFLVITILCFGSGVKAMGSTNGGEEGLNSNIEALTQQLIQTLTQLIAQLQQEIATILAQRATTTPTAPTACTPNWTCGWGPCSNGYQAQGLTDSNKCGVPLTNATIGCPTLTQACSTATQPIINSITPNPVQIGQLVTVNGSNLSGFEGDKNLFIENSAGQKGVIYSSNRGGPDTIITFTLAGSYCTVDNSYSGLPCPSYITITPGTYSIYAQPWSTSSNRVVLNVVATSSTYVQPSITSITPTSGATGTTVTIYGSNLSGVSSVEFYATSGQLAGSIVPSSVSYSSVTFAIAGPFAWNEPAGYYQISVVGNGPGGINSNRIGFTLTAPTVQPSITVISPNGGELFNVQNDIPVTWSSSGLSSGSLVDIQLLSGNSVVFTYPSTPNDGQEILPLTALRQGGSATGNQYNVKVQSSLGGIYDTSDNYFTISSSIATAGVCSSANGATLSGQPTNLCSIGAPSAVTFTQSSLQWTWTCQGINGGAVTNCSALSASVNAFCGSANGVAVTTAPTTNLCSSGLPTHVEPSADSSYWYWSCSGSGRGTSQNCTANVIH